MNDRITEAVELFREGFNCAQAVAAATGSEAGAGRSALLRLASGFGGGAADSKKEICGAASGMMIALGAKLGSDKPLTAEERAGLYGRFSPYIRAFADKFGGLRCCELLAGKPDEVPKREYCEAFVQFAAELAVNGLEETD